MGSLDNPIPDIQNSKHLDELYFRTHALEKMFEREITLAQVEQVLDCSEVEIIENYPPVGYNYSHCLIIGEDNNGRYLHVLVAYPINEICTVYEPTLPKWVTPRQRGNI